ncbi:CLP protease regulatory subunit CLPX2, mitochondrial isoform X4 [Arachis duranensis]|uniref:CLP protease regulatory subunit CLPX2, mitochondrial isoform X4 n=1 Tax=Arachis duranensis TaxID=130453 RepID=A0A6P4CG56_ARADU|nr:CLP protease regulatory subunit CLPX2, mitochondrial isoform X4 [Arachis duranensis]
MFSIAGRIINNNGTTTITMRLIPRLLSLHRHSWNSVSGGYKTLDHRAPKFCCVRHKSEGGGGGGGGRRWWSGNDDRYDHIRTEANCPRCSKPITVVFSNRPLSISAHAAPPGLYQALNLCPSCRTAFYFRPVKLSPLHGEFFEIGRVNAPLRPPVHDHDCNHHRALAASSSHDSAKKKSDLPTPKQIFEALNRYVVGQEKAKKVLSVAVYNHYSRIHLASLNQSEDGDDVVEPEKSNVMLIGPTGSGKTLLAKTLARAVNVPFAIADATTLTQAGYVGEDVESILYRLLEEADFDVELAQRGIVYVDEVDKITKKVVSVPDKGASKHHAGDNILIDTKNILFICGGAFVNLEKTISERQQNSSIGFGAPVCANMRTSGFTDALVTSSLLEKVESGDLIAYGLIPEFVGRFPILSGLSALNEEQLFQVLVEPKNALVKQYRKMFEMNNVNLHFTDTALRLIAKKAMAKNTGARGLRALLENILTEAMFEIPNKVDVDNVKAVLVDEEAVGSLDGPGCGAKILYSVDDGALEDQTSAYVCT